MYITSLLSLTLVYSVSLSSSSCPTGYTYCANEGGSCNVPSQIEEGFISYGTNDRYTLVWFTTDATLNLDCNNDLGDIYPSNGNKQCCYLEADTIFPVHFTGSSIEEHSYYSASSYSDPFTMRYGRNGNYLYRVVAGARGWCKNNFFSDPVPGVAKVCFKTSDVPPAIESHDLWEICSNENSYCNGLSAGTHWIKYGADGSYYFKLVVTGDNGAVPCNNGFFEDPIHGTSKYCWKSELLEVEYSFSNAVGSWQRIPSCGGCSSNEYTKTIGIEELTESEMSTSWETSLTATLETEYTFGSVELSATVAETVTDSLRSAFTVSQTQSLTFTCEKDNLYQWVTGVTQSDGVTFKDFTIQSDDFWCIDSGLTPQCAPGYCQDSTDSNCQTCTY